MRLSKNQIFLFFLFVLFIHHFYGYIGHFGYDDMLYAKLSAEALRGVFDFENHFTFRFPIILMTAISYKLLGISDMSSAIPPLIISSLTLFIVYLMLRDEKKEILASALALTLCSKWFLIYSDKLMPDIYVSFGILAALATFYFFRYKSDFKKPFWYSILFVLSLLFAFSSKGTVILILPVLMYYFIFDLIYKRFFKFWIFSILNGILFLGLYFVTIKCLTGSFLKRFDAIAQNSYINPCSYELQPAEVLIERVTYEFVNMSIYQGLILGFLFILAGFMSGSIGKYLKLSSPIGFLLTTGILMFFSSNFMSISLSGYSPMCVDPRHFLFVVPIFAMGASFVIDAFVREAKGGLSIMLILAIVSGVAYFLPDYSFYTTYLPMTILFLVYYFVSNKEKWAAYFYGFFVLICLMVPLNLIWDAQERDYDGRKKFVYEHIINDSNPKYVITNDVQRRLGKYYTGFQKNHPVQFLEFNTFKKTSSDLDASIPKYLLINWYTEYLSGLDYNSLPPYAKDKIGTFPLIAKDDNLGIQLYDISELRLPGDTIFTAFNDFEGYNSFWSVGEEAVVEDSSYSGKISNRFNEYSAAFVYDIDSLNIESNEILFEVELKVMIFEKTNAKIVISLESEGEIYFWKYHEVINTFKAFGNWFTVGFETGIAVKDIKPGSILNVYVWSEDGQTIYIDDVKINVIQ